jgi:hypothetical protein
MVGLLGLDYYWLFFFVNHLEVCQNLVPLVNIKIAGIYGCSSP